MKNNYKAIGPFTQLFTLNGLPLKGAIRDEQLQMLPNAGLLIADGKIAAIDTFENIQQQCKKENIPVEYMEIPAVALPGFVDAHTHICFAGSRAQDYAMRVSGKSYLDIAKEGGGIWDTVKKTRAATQSELASLTAARAKRAFQSGVTTIEVKTGYGLTAEEELKMLYAIREAQAASEADLISTCLPAHILPKDFAGNQRDYLQYLFAEFFPVVQQKQLSQRADIFVEESAFSEQEAKFYLSECRKRGFQLTLHADQFSTGGSQLAIDYQALSADHLEASGRKEIEALAKSAVIATALPGASIGLGCAFTPGRQLLDAGAALAIASDWNPGSAPMGDLLTLSSIYGASEKLSLAETLAGITFRAAAALNLTDRGTLEIGKLADFVAFPTNDYREIFYQQGQLRPIKVWKEGSLS